MARQRLEMAVEIVAAGIEAQADRVVGEPALEGLGVEIAGALVEQAGDQIGAAGGVVGIAVAPPSKAKSTAISGRLCSSTSQASTPAGERTFWTATEGPARLETAAGMGAFMSFLTAGPRGPPVRKGAARVRPRQQQAGDAAIGPEIAARSLDDGLARHGLDA